MSRVVNTVTRPSRLCLRLPHLLQRRKQLRTLRTNPTLNIHTVRVALLHGLSVPWPSSTILQPPQQVRVLAEIKWRELSHGGEGEHHHDVCSREFRAGDVLVVLEPVVDHGERVLVPVLAVLGHLGIWVCAGHAEEHGTA